MVYFHSSTKEPTSKANDNRRKPVLVLEEFSYTFFFIAA